MSVFFDKIGKVMTKKIWDRIAGTYEEEVISLTRVPQKRRQILNEIKRGKILNLGTGPTIYLNKELIKQGNEVIATDFSKEILQIAMESFNHCNLEYKFADNRKLPFGNDFFDSVISVNSILPEKRKDIDLMIKEIHRVLKVSGKFIAFLPSFETVTESIKIYHTNPKIDKKNLRVFDSGQWQCFYTVESIKKMMQKAGFRKYKIKKSFLKTKDEINQIKKIYGIDTSKYPTYHYFLSVIK